LEDEEPLSVLVGPSLNKSGNVENCVDITVSVRLCIDKEPSRDLGEPGFVVKEGWDFLLLDYEDLLYHSRICLPLLSPK
jgi:hypothetical protein